MGNNGPKRSFRTYSQFIQLQLIPSGHVRNLPYNLPFSDVVTGSIERARLCTALSVAYSLKKTRKGGLHSPQQNSSQATIMARRELRHACSTLTALNTYFCASLAEHIVL